MKLKVKLFSIFREAFNAKEIEIQVDDGNEITIAKLKEILSNMSYKFRELMNSIEPIFMVNGIVATDSTRVSERDDIALLPPASGGSKHVYAKLFKDDSEIDFNTRIESVLKRLGGEGVGAIAIFIGVVKDVVEGHKVEELVYDAYEPYATKALEKIALEESMVEDVKAIEIMHRVGLAKPGEKTLYILVASKNRKDALNTLSRVLERVKHEVPIYKLEKRDDGYFYVIGDGKRIKKSSEVS